MKLIRRSTLVAMLGLALPSFGALAQASAPLPELSAASAPGTASATSKNGPRLRSPIETGNRAAAPGDLHPERPVTPQISIPFGKKAAAPTKGEERAAATRPPPAASTMPRRAANRRPTSRLAPPAEPSWPARRRASCRTEVSLRRAATR